MLDYTCTLECIIAVFALSWWNLLSLSLTSETELVNQGLRTLELCVDNLTQDFLEPILAPVLPELLNALWSFFATPRHLSHSLNLLSVFLVNLVAEVVVSSNIPLKLEYVESKTNGISLVFEPCLNLIKLLQLPLDVLVDLCLIFFAVPVAKPWIPSRRAIILNSLLGFYPQFGYDVLKGLNFDVSALSSAPFAQDSEPKFSYDEDSVLARLKNQNSVESSHPNCAIVSSNFKKKLLSALFFISVNTESELAARANNILENIGNHFVYIQILAQRNHSKDYSFAGLTPNLFLEVLAEITCGPIKSQSESALSLLVKFDPNWTDLSHLRKFQNYLCFFLLVEKLIAYCYGSEFGPKIGACRGLRLLCEFNLGARWMWMQESRIVRGLLFILKDVPAYATESETKLVSDTLLAFLRLCHSP